MTPQFQCCRGPSGSRAHIRDLGSTSLLVLCEATAPAVNIVGSIPGNILCTKCVRVMLGRLGWKWDNRSECLREGENVVTVTPELIGLQEFS